MATAGCAGQRRARWASGPTTRRRSPSSTTSRYGNRTGGPADGGGFDLDQNVANSIVQFNYSHDNAGAGYMLAHGPATDTHRSNVVRFNISENDGRRNHYGAIELWGRVLGAEIYHNTVFVTASASGTPRAVHVSNTGVPGSRPASVDFRNNILQSSAARRSSMPQPASSAERRTSASRATRIPKRRRVQDPVARLVHEPRGWRTTTQEVLGGQPVGVSADPRLNAAGSGGTADDATRLELVRAYELRDDSPCARPASTSGRDSTSAMGELNSSAHASRPVPAADWRGAILGGAAPSTSFATQWRRRFRRRVATRGRSDRR